MPVPIVTAPFRANARPISVTLLFSVMVVSARMLPCHVAGPPPIVAELPIWKYTFLACALLIRMMLPAVVIVPVTKGRLDFGPWQRVFYGEWDGQRPKRVLLKAMGE